MDEMHIELGQIESSLHRQFSPGEMLRLPDTPVFPLAFQVPLPEGSSATHGQLGIRLENFAVARLDAFQVDRSSSAVEDGRARVVVGWKEIEVRGRYSLTAKATPLIRMDTGGTMFEPEDDEAQEAGASSLPPLTPDQTDAMLNRARDQRTRLMDDPNGQQLMSVYNEHNEVYNTVFVTSPAARTAWAAQGATKEMAEHTYDALDPKAIGSSHVNPDPGSKTFGPNQVSYNGNAFQQQLQIIVNTVATDPNFNPFDPDAQLDPNSKFTKASLAAMTFGTGVGQTGNDGETVKPLTGDQVYGSVKTGSKPPDATVDELQNLLSQSSQSGGAAAAVALNNNWRVLTEGDRKYVRQQLHARALERVQQQTATVETLWSGVCTSTIRNVLATLYFVADGGRPRFDSIALSLPAFELYLDDSSWSGEAGEIARERLAEMVFLRSLLRERVEKGIADRMAECASERRDDQPCN